MLHGWGGPVEVDGNQIETLTKDNECYTTGEIAHILKVNKSIKLSVKMKNVAFILWKKHGDFLGNPVVVIPNDL